VRIAILSTPHVPTPPQGYGASELIAGQLAEGLSQRGHEVHLFASEGSTKLVQRSRCYPQQRLGTSFDQRELIHVAHAVREAGDCDLVHNHCLAAGPPFARISRRPFLTTLHYLHPVVHAFPEGPYVAISQSQRRLASQLNVCGMVYNGVDLRNFPFGESREDYLLFLGRFHPNKGADLAIEVARRLDRRLILAAPAPPDDQRGWFDEKVRPHLQGKVEWIGPVEGDAKARLLGRAAATLLPLRWDEPFGLVMIESMACGTPPVAMRRGAAPEIILDGVTGLLVDDLDQFVAAVEQAPSIDPYACRARVEQHFSVDRMVDDYLRLYRDYLMMS
jgi:glycosyltransferase involved in cell wall biosynthesis